MKLFNIMIATSFQDWKTLSSREDGDGNFVEGDILRATGNIAGNTAGYVFKSVGKNLGKSVRSVTTSVGDGIENATGKIGARRLGTSVNSVISGVGHGFSDTLTGGKLSLA